MSHSEKRRLQDLISFRILDSEPEVEFDRLTEKAAQICDMPMAYLTFVDRDRVWIKSAIGFDQQELPRKGSFSDYAIQNDAVMIVENTLQDPRFSNFYFVTHDPNIRFYAGAPILSQDGFRLGTIAVMDSEPRVLSTSQIQSLFEVSAEIALRLELRRARLRIAEHSLRTIPETKFESLSRLTHLGEITQAASKEIDQSAFRLAAQIIKIQQEAKVGAQITPELKSKYAEMTAESQALLRMIRVISSYEPSPQVTSITELLETTLSLCRSRIQKNKIAVSVEHPTEDLFVFAHSSELIQGFLNLISNAIDALEQGTLAKEIKIRVYTHNSRIRLAFENSGPIIPKEIQAQIFSPFFTTKENNKGTGIGLGSTQHLIEKAHGTIHLDSEAHITTFIVDLPAFDPEKVQSGAA